jgi:hypothetical protein
MSTQPPAERPTRNIPPLAWIVLVLLVLAIGVSFVYRRGEHVTPSGGTMPQAPEKAAVMPAAPATGDAPATPGSVVAPPASQPSN